MHSRISFFKAPPIVLLFFFIASHSFVHGTFAQEGEKDYVRIDSVYSQGEVSPLGKDRIRFRAFGEEPVIYTASEVKEYGVNGKTYESFVLENGDPAFYRRIAGNQTAIFKVKDHYMLRHQGELTPLNKQNFRSTLGELPGPQGADRSLARLTFSEPSLRTFISDYTKGHSPMNLFPHQKIGLLVGYQVFRVSASMEPGIHMHENATTTFSAGIFTDFPLYRPRMFYVTTEFHVFNFKASLQQESVKTTHFLGLDAIGLQTPLGVKWLLAIDSRIFYLKASALISYISLQPNTHYFTTVSNGPDVEIFRPALEHNQQILWGSQLGIGSEIPWKNRRNFHLELKWTLPARGDFDSFRMNLSGISIYAGINI